MLRTMIAEAADHLQRPLSAAEMRSLASTLPPANVVCDLGGMLKTSSTTSSHSRWLFNASTLTSGVHSSGERGRGGNREQNE